MGNAKLSSFLSPTSSSPGSIHNHRVNPVSTALPPTLTPTPIPLPTPTLSPSPPPLPPLPSIIEEKTLSPSPPPTPPLPQHLHFNLDPRPWFPQALIFDPQTRQVVITDNYGYLHFFDYEQIKYLKTVGSPSNRDKELDQPSDLCLQPSTRHLWVCDQYKWRIQVYGPPETCDQPLYTITPRIPTKKYFFPRHICSRVDGAMAVTSSMTSHGDQYISLLDPTGRYLTLFGDSRGPGVHQLDRPGKMCFLSPHLSPSSSVSVNDSVLIVNDTFNSRLAIYNLHGSSPRPLYHIPLEGYPKELCFDARGYAYLFEHDVSNVNSRVTFRQLEPRMNWQQTNLMIDSLNGRSSAMTIGDCNNLILVHDAPNTCQSLKIVLV